MAIDPVSVLKAAGNPAATEQASTFGKAAASFQDMLLRSISEISESETAVQDDMVRLVSGESDALHSITINAAKADLAITTMVSVRNKALDAYSEIMRITL